MRADEAYALEMDAADEMSSARSRFSVPEGLVYMLGNSLGLMPDASSDSMERVAAEWRGMGIGGWLGGEKPWFYLAESIGEAAAQLVGAVPDEVICTGTTTFNIHSLVSSFYRPEGERTRISGAMVSMTAWVRASPRFPARSVAFTSMSKVPSRWAMSVYSNVPSTTSTWMPLMRTLPSLSGLSTDPSTRTEVVFRREPGSGDSMVTTGGVMSRTTVTVAKAAFPARSTASTRITFSPGTRLTSVLKAGPSNVLAPSSVETTKVDTSSETVPVTLTTGRLVMRDVFFTLP